VWYSLLTREADRAHAECHNPATRGKAIDDITAILAKFCKQRVHTLIGFDFAYGYPSGFAKALGLRSNQPWRAVWDTISALVKDDDDNRNNRFETAAELNKRVSSGAFPFWGCPTKRQSARLSSRKTRQFSDEGLAEYRLTERSAKGAQSVWKLAYPGSVGSQALLGITYLARLRDNSEFGGVSRIWPFETGLRPLACREQRDWIILHAEIFPSLFLVRTGPGEIRDEVQVRNLAACFAQLDEKGELAKLFDKPDWVTDKDCHRVASEEGWILGVC
jgi:hypothetical protein